MENYDPNIPIDIYLSEDIGGILMLFGKYVYVDRNIKSYQVIPYWYKQSLAVFEKYSVNKNQLDNILFILSNFYSECRKEYHKQISATRFINRYNDRKNAIRIYNQIKPLSDKQKKEYFGELSFQVKPIDTKKMERIVFSDYKTVFDYFLQTFPKDIFYIEGLDEDYLRELHERKAGIKLRLARAQTVYCLKKYLDIDSILYEKGKKTNKLQSSFIGELLIIWEIIPGKIIQNRKWVIHESSDYLFRQDILDKGISELYKYYKKHIE